MMRSKVLSTKLLAGFVFFCGVLVSVHATGVDDETAPAAKEAWKADDFIYGQTAGQFRISPDAKWVVWVKTTGDKEKDLRVTNLVLSSLTASREIPLTRGSDNNTQPRWSPDGEWIAFTSTRARPKPKPDTAPMQIWLINAHGGEPWALTELAHPPKRLEWLDKDTLIYSAEEDPALYEQELKKKKDDSEVVDDAEHAPPVRLYKMNVKDKKVARLTSNTDWIEDFGVSPDKKYVVASHAKSLHYTFDQKVRPQVYLHDLSGQEKQIFADLRVRPEGFEWAPDSSGFYMATPFSTDARFMTAGITIVYFYEVASGKSTQVNLDNENGLGFDLQTIPGGFLALLAAGSHDDFARYAAEKVAAGGWTWKRRTISGEHAKNLEAFRVSGDGKTIVYSSSTASRLSQPFRAQLDGDKLSSPAQLTNLNEGLVKGRSYAKSEVIRWKGANNEEVEGILYYPLNYDAAKKYPLITAIHGGPMGADKDLWGESWAYPLQLFTDRGAFVLRPNYHGSNNYGLKWAESICCGKYYDLETPDINAGVDFLITQGKVDAERIATMGWSNGSILSTGLITTYPARYKVASVGAGDIEWLSDWGNVDFGQSFDAYYFGKSPFEDPQLYINKSPFFKMDRVQAPVLIFHGTADRNVPPAQSWSYFRALQHFDKTVKYVVFPGEPHGPRKLTHQLRKVEEEVAWFDRYFFKTAKPEDEAVKQGTPLDALMKGKHCRLNDPYGSFQSKAPNGKAMDEARSLVPATVDRNGLSIGCFEVTRSQYRVFDPKFAFAPSMANFPANNVTLENAEAYVKWLNKLTGQTWRLPYEDELKELYENREGENTLDYWAGYAPNPEDAAKLREKAKQIGNTAPLLKEAGTFAGKGTENEEPIYDLGGNVAEWVLTRDGKGKVIGGSADCPADPKANCTPAPEYVGFRVVRGAAKPAASSQERPQELD